MPQSVNLRHLVRRRGQRHAWLRMALVVLVDPPPKEPLSAGAIPARTTFILSVVADKSRQLPAASERRGVSIVRSGWEMCGASFEHLRRASDER